MTEHPSTRTDRELHEEQPHLGVAAPADGGPAPSLVRLRAFVFALPVIAIDNYWVIMMEKVRSGPYPTTISLFANAVFVLAVLCLLNAGLRRVSPRLAFSSAEMLLIYAMVAISSALAGHDMLPCLVGMMAYPFAFATPENRFAETFLPYLPKHLTVSDPEALKGLWLGGTSLYADNNWLFWLKPALFWLAFVVVLVWVMMCINTIVRKQWVDRERLTFPVVQLPLAMTEPGGAVWKSRLFWTGFAIAFAIDLLNGLALYFPAIPAIKVGFEGNNLAAGMTSKPWSAIGWLPWSFYPFAIGMGYLLPTDLCFSCWFFYLFWKLVSVVVAAMGMDSIPGFPYVKHQAFGGLLAIVATMFWTSRSYLKQVWYRATGKPSELDDSDEPMSYLTAMIGGVIGLAFLSWFFSTIGLSPLLAVAVFIVYFVVATALARIRAELGPPVHDFHFSGPDSMLVSGAGIAGLGKRDLVGLTFLFWFNRAYRAHPMPMAAESMKMADSCKTSQRKFLWGTMIAIAVGTIATFWAYLYVGYKLGFSGGVSQGGVYAASGFRNLEIWWSRPAASLAPDWGSNFGIIFGFAFCMLLSYMRLNVVNMPFNPIGFVVSASWQINTVWVPLLLAWIIKSSILKFGGLRLYKVALPFFLGLILGEMVIGCIWSIIGISFNIPYFNFWGA